MAQTAGGFPGRVDSRLVAETELAKHQIKSFGAEFFADFHRSDIARIFNDLLQ